jgi:glycosyltransferase involved in cell wall biosynthesis
LGQSPLNAFSSKIDISFFMKIAVFSDNFYPELSGISDSLLEQARELSNLGHEIVFFVPRYGRKDFAVSHLPYQEIRISDKITVKRLFALPYPAPTKQGRMVIPTFLAWLSLRKHKPDIIHAHLFFGAGFEGLAASFFLHRPLVGTSHTPLTEFLAYSPLQAKFLKHLALRFVSWYYNRCDFVTAPSQGILDEMRQNGFHKPSRVISNPIDLDHFFPPSSDEHTNLKKKFGLTSFALLYTGRLAPEKHIDDILRAVAHIKDKIPEICLAITGHGEAESSLRTLARELGIEARVKFFGTVSNEDHARIYRAADVFTIMSTAETQSLSMMKAMATGIPAIGADARGLAEYIKDDENGYLVSPHDYKALAEKILFLYQHPEERTRLGTGGITTVKQFSRTKIALEWQTLYTEVLATYNQTKK